MCNHRISAYHRSNPYIKITAERLVLIKDKARKLFVRSLVSQPLNTIINRNNSLIRGVCNYYSISRECRLQLNALEPYFYRQLLKIVKKKFGSKPKKISFIKSQFIRKGRFVYKRAIQIKPCDVKLNSSLNVCWVRTAENIFHLNIYMDKEIIEAFKRKKRIGINLNPLNCYNDFNKQELHEILIEYQDRLCPICLEELKHKTTAKELDHEPSIYQLRENILRQLIDNLKLPAGSNSILEVYQKLLKLPEIAVKNAIIYELRSNLFLRSVHTKCYKTIDRDFVIKEKAWRKKIRKGTNEDFYREIVKFRGNIKAVIKRYKNLSRAQIMEISKRKSPHNNIYGNG